MIATLECASTGSEKRDKTLLAFFAGIAGIFFIFLYYPTFEWLYERFVAPESYYSHGFLVPGIIAYLVWLKIPELRNMPLSGSRVGLALAVFALFAHFIAVLAGIHFLSSYTLAPLFFGVSLYFFGKGITSKIAFPLSFIVFMLPLPLAAINAVSFPLRMFATKASVLLMKLASFPVNNEGFRIVFPHESIAVGAPCSGLRSLITMLALGSLFAYLMEGKAHRRIVLVVAAIALALASNIIRIITLGLGTYYFGWEQVKGTFHDASGYAVFIGAFAALWIIKRSLEEKAR